MKITSTTSLLRPKTTRLSLVALAIFVAAFGSLGHFSSVKADSYDDRIKAIQSEISGFQSEAAKLSEQASSLQQAVDSLTAQKNTIQAQIDLSQAKYDKLLSDIEATKKKLSDQQDVLSSTIADMSVGSETTPIEVLAGSNSVGDYVSSQDYYLSIQDQLQSSITDIVKLQKELDQQKADLERVLADEKDQRSALATKEAEQAKLLADTQGQEAAYNNLISQKNSQVSDLRAQQAAANAAASRTYSVANLTPGGAGCGAYPAVWCYAAQDTLVDDWGMYNRECVSYVAWKITASGRYMPYWGGRGNANQWPGNARSAGIATDSTPQVGDAAVMYVGYYGHVMYVERINSDGTLHVSQFNWRLQGEYSEMDINPSGLTFIHF